MTGSTQDILISLNIAPEEMVRWYAGEANIVRATAIDGRKVKFPANILKPFVTREGVRGVFCIKYSAAGKFLSISRYQG